MKQVSQVSEDTGKEEEFGRSEARGAFRVEAVEEPGLWESGVVLVRKLLELGRLQRTRGRKASGKPAIRSGGRQTLLAEGPT